MKRLSLFATGVLLIGFAHAQAQVQEQPAQDPTDRAVGEAIASCNAKLLSGEYKTRVEAGICANDGITKAFQAARFPYMDLIYQFELSSLQTLAKRDRDEIADDDVRLAIATAVLELRTQIAQREAAASAQAQAAQAAAARDAAARDAAQAAAARDAAGQAAAEEARRRTVMQQFLMNRMFQPPPQVQPVQPYIMPTRPTTNCTSSVIGNQVYTNCQ